MRPAEIQKKHFPKIGFFKLYGKSSFNRTRTHYVKRKLEDSERHLNVSSFLKRVERQADAHA